MQPKLFFVLGAPKSGTTWLQHLLNAHPNVSCRSEGMFHQFAISFLQVIDRHNEALAERAQWMDDGFPPIGDKTKARLVRDFISWRMLTNPTPGKADLRWIGEKDPVHILHCQFMMTTFASAAFIHIIRDPRDQVVSLHFHAQQRYRDKDKVYDWREFVLSNAKHWAEHVNSVRANARQHPNLRYHELRYEDLLDRPHETLAAVFNFLGVDIAPVPVCIEAAAFEKLSGGRKPGQEDQASFFRKGIKGDWRNHMDAELERAFVAATGGLMAELGYA